MKGNCFKFLGLAIVAGLFCAGCAYKPPTGKMARGAVFVVDQSYDNAWRNASQGLLQAGFSLSTSDKDAGIITTQTRRMQIAASGFDCGIWGKKPVLAAGPAIARISVQMVLNPQGNRTTIETAWDISLETFTDPVWKTQVAAPSDFRCVALSGFDKTLLGGIHGIVEQGLSK